MIFLKKILQAASHPLTLLNGLMVGFMIVVGLLHNHAHYTMEVDADSYVRAFCKKNPDTCESYLNDY
jgi:hypothetical protein